jgi:hypothetical protein
MYVRLYAQTVLKPPVFHFLNFVQWNEDPYDAIPFCYDDMPRPQTVVGGVYGFQTWRVVVNVLNKQPRQTDKG